MKNDWYCCIGAPTTRPHTWSSYGRLLGLTWLVLLTAFGPAWAQGAANLDQIRNGAFDSPITPDWVNGNAGAQNSHYLEGHSIPYRAVLTGLPAGQHTLIIGWDVRDGGKNALDFITHYQNLDPHAQFGHPAETINPLVGLGLGSPSVTTIPIPAPSQLSGAISSPFSFFPLQSAGKEVMTMFNGSAINSIAYVSQGDRSLAHAETQLAIVFTTSNPTVVFAWGGHIGSQVDWGPGTSAVNINGAPYHTRIISLNGSGGNQDRSLSADAVIQPPTCAFSGPSLGCAGQALTFTGPAGMSSYLWTVTGGGAAPASGTGQSITVTAAASYTIQLVTTKSGVSSNSDCQQAVTINPTTTATPLTGLTRCPGDAAAFSTTAVGASLSYAWTKDGVPIADATGSSYSIAAVAAADAGIYAVTVSGTCGSATQSAVLMVNDPVAASDPDDLVRCPGHAATFTTTASGTGPLTYAWTKDGVPIAGATDPSYSLASVSAADAGTYAVTVSGACGSATQSASLTVNDPAAATALSDLTRCPGDAATFSTSGSGTGPLTYAWTKDGVPIADATGSSYSIAAVAAADAGTYAVTVTGVCGSAMQSAALVVNDPAAATALSGQTVCAGLSATFTTTGSGTGPLSYAWTKDGVPIADATNNSYTIAPVAAADAGTYAVTVSGACGSATQSASLAVNAVTTATALTPLTQCEAASATFSTSGSGTGLLSYAWTKDGAPIAGANGNSYTIASVALANAGTYAVTVSGTCGSATQSAALVVNRCQVQFCSLTQGGYSNGTGIICKFPGVRRMQLIANMFTTESIVLGAGGRSLTYAFTPGTTSAATTARLATAQCIIDRLPAGGTAGAFPIGMGDPSGCSVPSALLKNGKFNNVLIGQALTLALNMRLDAGLGALPLRASMTSYSALNCSGPNPADLVGITKTIAPAVLGNLGASPTVAGLLTLANKALGGVAYANSGGNPTATQISDAAAAINELFDNCRMYPVLNSLRPAADANTSASPSQAAQLAPAPGENLHAYPNPFSASTLLRFSLPQATHYQLVVFDLKGRQVARVSSGQAQAGVLYAFPLGADLAQGIYVVRLLTDTGNQSLRLSLVP